MELRWWLPSRKARPQHQFASVGSLSMDAERLRAPGSALRDRHASRLRPLLRRPELAVALVGAAVLVGWAFDVTVLKSVSPHYSSMKPNAALAFVLVGIGLTLVRPADGAGTLRVLGRLLAASGVLIGSATVLEYAFGWNLGIDELLFDDDPTSPGTIEPGRMSINSAIDFVLAGGSILALDARRPQRVRPTQVAAVVICTIATVSIASYLFEAPLGGVGFSGHVTRMGLHTAFAFVAFGLALLLARPGVGIMDTITSPGAGGTILRRLLPASIVILLTVGWLRLRGEEAGLYEFRVGLALMVTSAIAAIFLTVFLTARSLERTDRERRRMFGEVQARTAELEVANRELEAFSYSVSHDLRAPLRAIDGFSRILEGEFAHTLEPSGQRYLRMVSENARAMGGLIDGLLAFARLGQQPLSTRHVRVRLVVDDAIADVRPQLEDRDVELAVLDLPATVEADPTLLKQVFVNLLSNAVKYTRGREAARVEVGAVEKDGQIAFFVRDNGVGFDMRYADKLFQVFQRLHRAEEYEGAGVGLALVARIVRRHGGTIWAESEPDKGATFSFTLGGLAQW